MVQSLPAKGRKWSVDTTRWPLLIVTQHAPTLTDAERMEALEDTERALGTDRGKYAVIHDSRLAGPLTPTQRAMIAEYSKRHDARTRARCVCNAFVFDSLVMRGALTAIMWLKPPVVESKVFSNLEDAITWARTKIEEARSEPSRRAV